MSFRDTLILSYNDSLVYQSDLDLLKEGNWLNDRLIGFVCDYFENEIFKVQCENNLVAFLNPSTVQYLKLCESLEEAKMCFMEPLSLKDKKVIFLPLNNNQSVEAGGCHWSLLVIDTRSSKFKHYDSIGSNQNEAEYFFQKYKDYFESQELEVVANFPKQKNSSDCGAYVLAGIELIAEILKRNNQYKLSDMNYGLITSKYIRDLRKKYNNLILLLSSASSPLPESS